MRSESTLLDVAVALAARSGSPVTSPVARCLTHEHDAEPRRPRDKGGAAREAGSTTQQQHTDSKHACFDFPPNPAAAILVDAPAKGQRFPGFNRVRTRIYCQWAAGGRGGPRGGNGCGTARPASPMVRSPSALSRTAVVVWLVVQLCHQAILSQSDSWSGSAFGSDDGAPSVRCPALDCWELGSAFELELLGTCPDCHYPCGPNGTAGDLCAVRCKDGFSSEHPAAVGSCSADDGAAAGTYRGQSAVCTPSTCPVPALDVGQAILSGCVGGGTMGVSMCEVGCGDGYYAGAPASTCNDGVLPTIWVSAGYDCVSIEAAFDCAHTVDVGLVVGDVCPVTCDLCPPAAYVPDTVSDIWEPTKPCSDLCGHMEPAFEAIPFGGRVSGTAFIEGGVMQLTGVGPGLARKFGVFVYDPLFDDKLLSVEIGFNMSAYGGAGADGMSFHLSPGSETSDWIDVANYQAFENIALSTGLSINTDEREGHSSLWLNGREYARGAYRGGRDLTVQIRWTPAGLSVLAPGFDFYLANASTVLQPDRSWVLSWAARTGMSTNIHTLNNFYVDRCYRDYATVAVAMDGMCLPHKGRHDFNSTHALWIPNSTAGYHVQKPYCVPAICGAPTLGPNQLVLSGCQAGGILGASTCNLSCVAGYTAANMEAGLCSGDLGSITASYQGHSVDCIPDGCQAPIQSAWRKTVEPATGVSYYVNLQTGGQSFTMPDDGTIPHVSPFGGCVEGAVINRSGTCTPRCGAHYGASETALFCNGLQLTPSGITTYRPPELPLLEVHFDHPVHIGHVRWRSACAPSLTDLAALQPHVMANAPSNSSVLIQLLQLDAACLARATFHSIDGGRSFAMIDGSSPFSINEVASATDGRFVADGTGRLQAFDRSMAVSGLSAAQIENLTVSHESIRLESGELLATAFGVLSDSPGGCAGRSARMKWQCSSLLLLSSADNGTSWSLRSRMEWTGGPARVEGLREAALGQLPDGRVVLLASVGSNSTLWKATSTDDGVSFSALEATTMWSVAPKLIVLPNGAIIITSGRPGIGMWICIDGEFEAFGFYNLAWRHNANFADPALHFRYEETRVSSEASVAVPAQSTAHTGLVLLECISSTCTVLISYDRYRDEDADPTADVFSQRVTITTTPDPMVHEFSCIYCYDTCSAVLDECPTCESGTYPICTYEAFEYVSCNMEYGCAFDFAQYQDAWDDLMDENSISSWLATAAEPQNLALDVDGFAIDGAYFIDGMLVVEPQGYAFSTTVYDRPLQVNITARQSSRDVNAGDCINMYVFPQEAGNTLSGYAFGGGWWRSCVGSGNSDGGTCDVSVSNAVNTDNVQLTAFTNTSTCLENTLTDTVILIACTASAHQMWELRSGTFVNFQSNLCLHVEQGAFGVSVCSSSSSQNFAEALDGYCNEVSWDCLRSFPAMMFNLATASSELECTPFALNCASQAFDSVYDEGARGVANGNFWHSAKTGMPQWLQYDFQREVKLCSYAIVARHADCCADEDSPHAWELQGTNDGGFWADYTVLDNRTQGHWSGQERRVFSVIPTESFRWYRIFITATGTNEAAVLAELELFEIKNNSSFICSGSEKWSDEPAVDFRADHSFTLDLLLNGTVNFFMDGALQRTWVDSQYNYGVIGAGSQCTESTISSVVVSQICEVSVHIHVNATGFDTRWNLDRMPQWEYGPYDGPVLTDYYQAFEVTSGTHTLNAYAIIDGQGWQGGYWEVLNKDGVAITSRNYVAGRGASTHFKVACGHSSQNPADTTPCDLCPPGTMADPDCARSLPLTLESSVCVKCPPGKYSTARGAHSCISCQVGQYAGTGSTKCDSLCPPGFAPDYSAVCTRACSRCPQGYYSDGATGCQACQLGRSASIATGQCQLCAPGKFAENMGQSRCTNCPGGRFSPAEEAVECISCGAGEYAFLGSDSCAPCPAGKYTAMFEAPYFRSCINCRAGRYSAANSSVACHTCALEYFAIAGQSSCTICGPGTYSSVKVIVGGSVDGQFWGTSAGGFPSLGGQYSVGGDHPDNCTSCPGGQYSAAYGAANCALCSPGKYSVPRSTFCRNCPSGTASASRGAWTCSACVAGRYAPTPASTTCELCGQGQYTSLPVTESASACQTLKREQDSTCSFIITTSARLGFFCDSDLSFAGFPGQNLEQFCPGSCGTCLDEDQTNTSYGLLAGPTQCYFCPVGTSSRTTGASSPDVCNACGSDFVDHDHDPRTACIACIPGRYADHVDNECQRCLPGSADTDRIPSTRCVPCAVGTYSSFGSSTCDECAAGYADTDRSPATECVECTPGYYSAVGSAACAACLAGFYDDDSESATECLACPIGSYSPGDRSPCEDCPPGHADEDRDPSTECAQCPPGHFLPQGATLCIPCSEGTVDSDSDASTPCASSCSVGTYAARGSWQCVSCASGTFDHDGSAATACAACRVDTCAVSGASFMCGKCESTVEGTMVVHGLVPKAAIVAGLNAVVPDGSSVSSGSVTQTLDEVHISIFKRGHRADDYMAAGSLRAIVFEYGVAYALLGGKDPIYVPDDDIVVDIVEASDPNPRRRQLQAADPAAPAVSLEIGVMLKCTVTLTSQLKVPLVDVAEHLSSDATMGRFLHNIAFGMNKKQSTRDVVRNAGEQDVPLFRIDTDMITVAAGSGVNSTLLYELATDVAYTVTSTVEHEAVASTLSQTGITAAIAREAVGIEFNVSGIVVEPGVVEPVPSESIAGLVVLLLLMVIVLATGGFYGRRFLKARAARREAALGETKAFELDETEDERMAREAEEERQILAEQTRGEREMLEKAEAAVEKIRREKNLKLQEKQQRESQWQDDKARRIMEKQGNLEAAKQEHAAERDRVLARLVALNGMGAGSGQKALADGGPSTPTRSNLGPPRNSPGSASSRGSTNLGSARSNGSSNLGSPLGSPLGDLTTLLGPPTNFRDRLSRNNEAAGASQRGVDRRYRGSGAQGGRNGEYGQW